MFKSYLKYFFTAKGAHSLHSPFVYQFYTEVMKRSRYFNDSAIREIRKELIRNKSEIELLDLGAGSRKNTESKRSVSEIAKVSGIRSKYGRLLARMVEFYQLKSSVELGTSLGLGTSYLALASFENKVVTLEGAPEVLKIAEANFKKLGLPNVHTISGNFYDNLEDSLVNGELLDLVYIDGNHTYQATMDYFNFYLSHTHDDSFIIIDDIHWSEEMERAWEEILDSPAIHVSMDLFRMGIVCKKSTQAKQHFVLRF